MAIIKRASNITKIVNKKYKVKSNTILKLSEKVTYEATHENLNFISNKNINFKGNHSE